MKRILPAILLLLPGAFVFGQAGIGTTSPTSWLDVRGSSSATVRTITGSATAAFNDQNLIFTGTSAATLTLPDASTCTGRVYWIKNASTTLPTPALTIDPAGSQTIEGGASYLVDEPYELVRITSNGSNWSVTAADIPVPKTTTAGGAWTEGGNTLKAIKTIGTISNYDFAFLNNNTESMRLSAAGLFGIGTNAPAGRLHFVSENSESGDDYLFTDYSSTTTAGLYLRKSRGTVASPANLAQGDIIGQFRVAPRYNGQLTRNDGSGFDAYYQGSGTTNLSDLRFFTSNTEQMRINELGNVGIGTSAFNSTSAEQLVVDAGNTSSYNAISGKGTIDNYLQLNIQNQSNTFNASSDVVATAPNGNESADYIDMGINSGLFINSTLPIVGGINTGYLYSTGNDFIIGNGASGQNLIFFNGGFANTNEVLRMTATGVGIGTTAPADKLNVAGILSPSSDNSYTMGKSSSRWSAVYAANGSIQTSDARLKTNIRPLDYGWRQLSAMHPVQYNWKNEPGGATKIGLIAQKVRTLVPEVVSGDAGSGRLGMNYSELIPVLIKTLKQQQHQLDLLKEQLASLEDAK